MNKMILLAAFVVFGVMACSNGTTTPSTVAPSPSPTPVVKNPCDVLRTDIFATVAGNTVESWVAGQIATLDATIHYRGNPPDDLDPLTPPQEPFDPARCESLDIVTWVLPGGPTAPRMELQGNLNRNHVRLKVYEPGYFQITVIPQGITAPPGVAAFHVVPGGGDEAFAPLLAGEWIQRNFH